MQFRLARVDDASAACKVLRRSIAELCEPDHGNDAQFLGHWLANKTPENVATWITDPGNVVYVAVSDGIITGIASMTRAGAVTLNYVSPDARFKGISKALLMQLEHTAAELGLAQCTLASTKTARRFYQSAGYREQQGVDSGWGCPMVKEIGPSGPTTR